MLPALLGESKTGRVKLVEHDGFRALAFRDGLWKFIETNRRTRLTNSLSGELFDLSHDLGETNNLISVKPGTGKKLSGELEDARKFPTIGRPKAGELIP